eukprot:CAMPEP_0180326416 /NCGR_PEP_ID=MMETSP0988-20121125/38980_1 /TAXON_ID=697907 /ORGANISM="non described non described, Strain CCMP2293" /LENGTH=30 /DNA_ID= /DNA_START= /DNA_END= /DNA_ORIENTATION=
MRPEMAVSAISTCEDEARPFTPVAHAAWWM